MCTVRNLSLLCLAAVFGLSAAHAQEPRFKSRSPLYAYLIVDNAAGKLLKLVFDESKGTGKGYDTLWADLSLDGKLAGEQPLKGSRSQGMQTRFPAFKVPFQPGAGLPAGEAWFDLFLMEAGEGQPPYTMANARLSLPGEGGAWSYSLGAPLWPGTQPTGVLATQVYCGHARWELSLAPDATPGRYALTASLGESFGQVSLGHGGKPVPAHLEVKDASGQVVLSRDFPYGPPLADLALGPGLYTFEVSLDTGPLCGMLRGSQTVVII